MKFVEIIDVCYDRKKDETLSHHALNFVSKCQKDIEAELTEYEALATILHLSKAKQKVAFEFIKSKFETKEPTLGQVRVLTYKQFAKLVHPDFTKGNDASFKALQELKEFLWDYKGNPREKIKQHYWSIERDTANGVDPFEF